MEKAARPTSRISVTLYALFSGTLVLFISFTLALTFFRPGTVTLEVVSTTVPGPSALLYYQNTMRNLFVAEIWQLLKRFPAKLKIRFFVMGMARQLEKLGARLVRVGPQKSKTMVVAQYGTASDRMLPLNPQ